VFSNVWTDKSVHGSRREGPSSNARAFDVQVFFFFFFFFFFNFFFFSIFFYSSRTRLVLLLLLAASLPVLIEHFIFYETFIGTISHTSQTAAPAKVGVAPPVLPVLMQKAPPPFFVKPSPSLANSKDKKLDLLNKLELAKLDANAQLSAKWKMREYGGIPFAVLSRRISTVRADGLGFFGQHPQFANHWFEVYGGDKDYGNKVFGYREVEVVKEGEEYILEDKSTPRREKVFLRVVVGKVRKSVFVCCGCFVNEVEKRWWRRAQANLVLGLCMRRFRRAIASMDVFMWRNTTSQEEKFTS
jgi:hypothetical protein